MTPTQEDVSRVIAISHLALSDGDGIIPPYAVRILLMELARLRAIVDKLPKTADGVPVVPGMDLWGPSRILWAKQRGLDSSPSKSEHVVDPSEYYSTLEAAQAAAGVKA